MAKNKADYSEIPTNATKRWPYEQYYLGEKDLHHRKNGHGQNCWSGAESLEWFMGKFLRDTMHGEGEYRWRFNGPDNASVTYEGQFYGNSMHGYGVMSYPDGRVFNGLFYKNMRWGPGIESHACLQEDVGLWRGTQLVRLAWRPQTPNVTLDLIMVPSGKACVEAHRKLLTTRTKIIGEVNSAIELLKQSGAEPLVASENWTKLYSKHCTDFASQACHFDVFDYEYYKNDVQILEEVDIMQQKMDSSHNTEEDSLSTTKTYYAWNNSEILINIMKHCYKQENQRNLSRLQLSSILSGPRSHYKRPGNHELNCRTLLMASYLGDVAIVTRLINESNVHPDIADVYGNTALMYAVCGDQTEIMHFLIEAEANANSYNDSCCTPLGVALMRFACVRKGIAVNGMVQALLPSLGVPSATIGPYEERPLEWQIVREQTMGGTLNRSASKTANKTFGLKKTKTSLLQVVSLKSAEQINDERDSIVTEEKQLYNIVNAEFSIRMGQLFNMPSEINPITYLFEASDMVKEIEASEEEQKKTPEKNAKKALSKIIKDTIKPSKEMLWQRSDKDISSITSADRAKIQALNRNMSTILQLLSDGADPRLVRCPQSAILLATVSGSLDLVRDLVKYGADVNEVFPQMHHYTALDWTISQPLSYENLDLARTLLESGANTNHRLKCEAVLSSDSGIPEIQGPTLLHAVLAKKTGNEQEEEIRRQLLALLLEYRCCSLSQFHGRSALDIAMKNMDTFDIFIKAPKTDLNASINDSNQNVLVKMFSNPFCKSIPLTERLQTITNLLLFGADPFLPCQDDDEKFANFFVFAKKTFSELDSVSKPSNPVGKPDPKLKKPEKPKKDEKLSMKSAGKLGADDVGDYKQAIDLVAECARILHIRWLQSKLLKELIKVVERYEHRQWNMIIPEHKDKKACGLWLNCHRCLEIWDILKTKRKKTFKDRRILKHVLCIVQFYCRRVIGYFKQRITGQEKDSIEADVVYILREHKTSIDMETEHVSLSRPYVMPELLSGADEKFEVCFECALPLGDEKILCSSCKLVSFCTLQCVQMNIHRISCHPCNDYLKMKYCTSPEQSESFENKI